VTKGRGSDANPLDGDRITIEIVVKDGKLAAVDPEGLVVATTKQVGEATTTVAFETVADANAAGGNAFKGCRTAWLASKTLVRLAHGRTVEDAFAIHVGELIAAMGHVPAENERCVLTVVSALRSALIDAHVASLAQATVEAKRMRVK
jgi:NifU-like protein